MKLLVSLLLFALMWPSDPHVLASDIKCAQSFEAVVEKHASKEKSVSDILNDPDLVKSLEEKNMFYLESLKKINRLSPQDVELAALNKSLKSKERVEKMVPGLYESIPTMEEMKIGDLEVKTKLLFDMRYVTTITDPSGRVVGSMDRLIDPKNKKIYFNSAFLNGAFKKAAFGSEVPKFIDVPEVLPLVPGKGIPTQTFITLSQMKMAKVSKGELREASAVITNSQTLSQVADSKVVREWILAHPGKDVPFDVVSRAFMETHTYKYFETIMTQSGHRIKSVTVAWVINRPASVLSRKVVSDLDDETAHFFLIQKKLPDGSLIPMAPDQPVPGSIDVDFELEPLPL